MEPITVSVIKHEPSKQLTECNEEPISVRALLEERGIVIPAEFLCPITMVSVFFACYKCVSFFGVQSSFALAAVFMHASTLPRFASVLCHV
jgi:hypothetical protein